MGKSELLYLKHAFNLSDEELCERWSENVVWQFFSGMAYYEPRLPCDATQIGRFRRVLGEPGVEQLLKCCGIALKQTFAKEGRELRRKAGGYAHAKQFKRLRRTVKRQRTILGALMRNARHGLELTAQGVTGHELTALAITELTMWLERAERIRTQRRNSKNKLYALHAPEGECIGKGKGRKPYDFGVKVSLAVTHRHG